MKIKKFFGFGGKDLIFKGRVLDIVRAPEPSDILWQNCEKDFQLRRHILIFFAMFCIVAVSFGILLGLNYLQQLVKRNPDKFESEDSLTIINIASSAGLLIINQVLWFSLYYLL